MSGVTSPSPSIMPVLSAGRHRSPRKGACFMEMASYLAGERWSDHPPCTHPLLALVARLVNDTVPDGPRSRLAPMIPSVIGVRSDDVRVDAVLALRCASTALPIAAASRQNALAVGVLSCGRLLQELDGSDRLPDEARAALQAVPAAERWARSFVPGGPVGHRPFRRHAAPHIVALAVEGIAQACVPDAHSRLVRLLEDCIADARRLTGADLSREPLGDRPPSRTAHVWPARAAHRARP
jgi:hypothetical protein